MKDCAHPESDQVGDLCTNEMLCLACGWLRDMLAWGSWDNAHANCKHCN